MKFNYRLCFRPSLNPTHHIHEVYYDDYGRVKFYDPEPAVAFGDDHDELYECCAKMWKAFDDEPLDLDRVDRKLLRAFMNENLDNPKFKSE
jgi:hypothetical protein